MMLLCGTLSYFVVLTYNSSPLVSSLRVDFLMVRQMTRAEREQKRREKLIRLEKRRQSVKTFLDAYWETKRSQKEALRQKEEGRYEKWAAERGLSVPDSSPQQPKKRMSKWEKRFLR